MHEIQGGCMMTFNFLSGDRGRRLGVKLYYDLMGLTGDDELPGFEYEIAHKSEEGDLEINRGFLSAWGRNLLPEYDEISGKLEMEGNAIVHVRIFDSFYIKRNGIYMRYKLEKI